MLKHLKSLSLYDCELLEKLPEDLGRLECLERLILERCLVLRDIPNNICRLKSLKYLSLHDSIRVEKLPEELGCLECLEKLDIRGTSINNLPPSISSLGGLENVQSEDGTTTTTTTTTTTGGCCTVLDVMFMKLSYKNGLSGVGYGNMKKLAVVEYYSKVIWNYHDEAAAQKQQSRLAVFWDRLEKLSRGRRGREPEDRNRRAEPETEKESRNQSIEREQDEKLSRRREQDRKPIGRGIDQKSTSRESKQKLLIERD
ncbi:hypothetical protein Ccrd_025047 [Cynara cardunculus var. scolymus]|uniref:Disease resistance R13L4/SHOC-2-like LRR domain-containing protein n=1 Tax=Cynara cardunculus var. scolymus TaxID=59895 RepID=A0A118JRJ4_CYNCS|nr:hypothetical protein Ccrd_025047 [Cynara cardunculus var. scolymus]